MNQDNKHYKERLADAIRAKGELLSPETKMELMDYACYAPGHLKEKAVNMLIDVLADTDSEEEILKRLELNKLSTKTFVVGHEGEVLYR